MWTYVDVYTYATCNTQKTYQTLKFSYPWHQKNNFLFWTMSKIDTKIEEHNEIPCTHYSASVIMNILCMLLVVTALVCFSFLLRISMVFNATKNKFAVCSCIAEKKILKKTNLHLLPSNSWLCIDSKSNITAFAA